MAFQCLHRSQMSSRGIQRSAGPTSRQSEDGAQKSILRVLRKDPTARLRKLESACSSVSSGSTQGVWRGLRQFQFHDARPGLGVHTALRFSPESGEVSTLRPRKSNFGAALDDRGKTNTGRRPRIDRRATHLYPDRDNFVRTKMIERPIVRSSSH